MLKILEIKKNSYIYYLSTNLFKNTNYKILMYYKL